VTRLVVVGGGVAGLAAAWEASSWHSSSGPNVPSSQNEPLEIIVVESAERFGGKLLTTPIELPDGTTLLIDEGADAFLARRPEATSLCAELGLDHELTSPAIGRAKVFVDGELKFLPSRAVLGVPLSTDDPELREIVGDQGVAQLVAATTSPHDPPTGDLAIGPFLREHLGNTVVERIVGPLVGGINAGDVDQLSLESVTPQLAAAAKDGGPLAIGLLSGQIAGDTRPVFQTPLGGTSRITERLVELLTERGVQLRSHTSVASMSATASGVTLELLGDTTELLHADAVVIATPAPVAAKLLNEASPTAAEGLRSIAHASVALLTLVFDHADVPIPLDASGFLVPRNSHTAITAVSWGSSKWAHWNDGRHVVVRASVGHDGDDRGIDLSDEQLLADVLRDLGATMGISNGPVATRITRWPMGFAQYRPQHAALVAKINRGLAAEAPTIRLAGAAYEGVGIPACIGSGRQAAKSLREALQI